MEEQEMGGLEKHPVEFDQAEFEDLKKQYTEKEKQLNETLNEMLFMKRRLDKFQEMEDVTKRKWGMQLAAERKRAGPPTIINFQIKLEVNAKDLILTNGDPNEDGRVPCWNSSCENALEKKESAAKRNESGRIPYMLGSPEDYVLIKFTKEKKREKAKLTVENEEFFKNLLPVLRKVLWNKRVEDDELDAMDEKDKKILEAILTKKKLVDSSEKIIYDSNAIKKISMKAGQKRNEENLKCIFKYTQKFLRMQFRKRHSDFKYRKCDSDMKQKNLIDLGFYMFYFGKIADENDWPISKFFHPKVFAGVKGSMGRCLDEPKMRPKTINREYIDNLKRSDTFMKDMSDFLNNQYQTSDSVTGIIKQYQSISDEKITQKLSQWCDLIKKKGNDQGLDLILKDLKNNDKCKLPWSIMEIQRAVQDTCNHFGIEGPLLEAD